MGILFNLLRGRLLTNKERSWLRQKQNIRRGLQEGAAQAEWRRIQPYDFSQRIGQSYAKRYEAASKSPNMSLPAPGEPALGLDYVQTRSFNPPPTGPREGVSRVIKQRRGSTINLKPVKLYGKNELQETRRAALSYRPTDQQPPGRGSMVNWDDKVRNVQKRPSYLTGKREAGKTTPEPSVRRDPYYFL